MHCFCRWGLAGILAITTPALALAGQGKGKQTSAIDRKDRRVDPTSWGNVFGRVYDAETGAPIEGAQIVVQHEGDFAEKGQTVAKTDKLGGYRTRAVLGRISHNFDVGRALLSSPLGMLFGSATNTTKRIDVARLNLRVSAPGFKPMELPVKALGQDAKAFRLDMEPILLVPEGRPGLSTPAGGWGAVRLEAVQLDPPVLKPGEKTVMRAWVRAYGKEPGKTVEVSAMSPLWGGLKKLKFRSIDGDGRAVFEADFGVGRKEKTRTEVIGFEITKSLLDVSPVDAPVPAVLSVANTDEEVRQAEARRAVVADILAERTGDASQKAGVLVSQGTPAPFDHWLNGIAQEGAGNYAAAVQSRKALLAQKPKPDMVEFVALTRVLHRADRDAEIPETVEPILNRIGDKEEPKVVPAAVMGYLGTAYVKMGRLADAEKMNERLLKWPTGGLDPAVVEFRNTFRLAQVESALKASPSSPTVRADYGRVLMDLGRYEEAIGELQISLKLDPQSQAAKRDLAWAAMHVGHAPEQAPTRDEAIAAAEAGLNLDKGKQRSKDFFSWQQYALLLFAKSEDLRRSNDPGYLESLDKSIDAFREALSLGRVGAKTNAGHYNPFYGQYLSGSEVAVSGFAYPQANSSFVLLESLKLLHRAPEEPLALCNLAGSLLELGQPTLAADVVGRLKKARPDHPETYYLEAMLALAQDNPTEGRTCLEKVLVANPRHPKANRLLADLLSREGDVAGAAQAMAAHSKWYGGKLAVK